MPPSWMPHPKGDASPRTQNRLLPLQLASWHLPASCWWAAEEREGAGLVSQIRAAVKQEKNGPWSQQGLQGVPVGLAKSSKGWKIDGSWGRKKSRKQQIDLRPPLCPSLLGTTGACCTSEQSRGWARLQSQDSEQSYCRGKELLLNLLGPHLLPGKMLFSLVCCSVQNAADSVACQSDSVLEETPVQTHSLLQSWLCLTDGGCKGVSAYVWAVCRGEANSFWKMVILRVKTVLQQLLILRKAC